VATKIEKIDESKTIGAQKKLSRKKVKKNSFRVK
jgi:hypothetical protein